MTNEITVGKWYWIAGMGPMRVEGFYESGNVRLKTIHRISYCAVPKDVRYEFTQEMWKEYAQRLKDSGVCDECVNMELW